MVEAKSNCIDLSYDYKEECNLYKKKISYYFFKRLIDVIGASCGLIFLSPLIIITAVLIKLDSPGPVFFFQKRVGFNGQLFNMYKFRSMCCNAETLLDKLKDRNETTGPMFKMKYDPRVTKVGRFIRKTSIDELPQLINVLKGEMSLVGPRPNLPHEVAKFTKRQRLKLMAKPGLTCYWQVMGRSNIGFEQWMELDIKYIKDRSMWLDIKLIFKTVGVLFGDENAS